MERGPWGSAGRAGGGSRGPRGYQSGQTRLDRPWFARPALSSLSRWDARSASGGPRLRRVPGGSPPPPPPPGSCRLGKSSRGCSRPLSWGILPSEGLWKGARAGSACPHPVSSPSVPRRATESPGAEASLIGVPPCPAPPPRATPRRQEPELSPEPTRESFQPQGDSVYGVQGTKSRLPCPGHTRLLFPHLPACPASENRPAKGCEWRDESRRKGPSAAVSGPAPPRAAPSQRVQAEDAR